MAPEQARDYQNADARCDIYSLGAVAYYLLTGRPAFTGANLGQVLKAHAHQQVVPPSQLEPSIPDDLEQVVVRCLAKDPGQRYQGARELDDALLQCRCADQWSDDDAAAWWKEADSRQTPTSEIPAGPTGHDKTEAFIPETIDTKAAQPDSEQQP
jgi:serine/threonine-protein kinase